MPITEQIADFTAFATAFTKLLTQQEGEDISLDVVYERWWQERHRDEDLHAIQEAHTEFESGERGELAREELADFRAERSAAKKP